MDNKGTAKTAIMRKLVCAFVVRKPKREVFISYLFCSPTSDENILDRQVSSTYVLNKVETKVRIYPLHSDSAITRSCKTQFNNLGPELQS